MKNINQFLSYKQENKKISMLTCYDYSFAKAVSDTNIGCLLVGDSLAMVMHGFDSTIHATPELMMIHTAAVKRGAPNKFIVADMPFLSFRKGLSFALDVAKDLMCAGANAVKIEGVDGHEDVISGLVETGIPVMGHLGLTPQSVHQLSGYRVQGKDEKRAEEIKREAQKLQKLGCFSLVLECVPTKLASDITKNLIIPTIGIGAGAEVDGQVLVLQDMLGLNTDFKPKFVRQFQNINEASQTAFNKYDAAVKSLEFPLAEESF